MGDNEDGSGRREREAGAGDGRSGGTRNSWLALLEVLRAKFTGFRIHKPVQEQVGKNVLGSDPVIHKGAKSSDEH